MVQQLMEHGNIYAKVNHAIIGSENGLSPVLYQLSEQILDCFLLDCWEQISVKSKKTNPKIAIICVNHNPPPPPQPYCLVGIV